ncbi:MAG: hypothetical protein ACTJHU_11410 [Mycetocola sp.]
MTRIDGRVLGRWSLRLDALYCAVLGLAVAGGAPFIASVVLFPVWLIVLIGVGVVLWAVAVWVMLQRLQLQSALRTVLTVNVCAAMLIAATALATTSTLGAGAVLTIAVDVGLFAASQVLALRLLAASRLA